MFVKVRRYPVYNTLWNEIANLESDIERVFNPSFVSDEGTENRFSPAINVIENGKSTDIVAELPGVSKDDIKISVENDVLTIRGTRRHNPLPEKAQWIRNEISGGDFYRSVRVPKGIQAEKISAELTNGMLKIVLPKAEEMKPREITIH